MDTAGRVIVLSRFLLFFVLVIAVTCSWAKYEILSYDECLNLLQEISLPYMFTHQKGEQVVYYFGEEHVCNPEHKQYLQLEHFWQEFVEKTKSKNCVVLVEGQVRKVQNSKQEAIFDGAGGSLVAYLARQEGIEQFCPEPDRQVVYNQLSCQFSKEEIDYLQFAHAVIQFYTAIEHYQEAVSFEKYYEKYLQRCEFLNLSYISDIHRNLFNSDLDIENKQFFYEITNPACPKGIIGQACRQLTIIRDQCIVDQIDHFLQQGKNIFVVYGCSHAVMQEKAIKNL